MQNHYNDILHFGEIDARIIAIYVDALSDPFLSSSKSVLLNQKS